MSGRRRPPPSKPPTINLPTTAGRADASPRPIDRGFTAGADGANFLSEFRVVLVVPARIGTIVRPLRPSVVHSPGRASSNPQVSTASPPPGLLPRPPTVTRPAPVGRTGSRGGRATVLAVAEPEPAAVRGGARASERGWARSCAFRFDGKPLYARLLAATRKARAVTSPRCRHTAAALRHENVKARLGRPAADPWDRRG